VHLLVVLSQIHALYATVVTLVTNVALLLVHVAVLYPLGIILELHVADVAFIVLFIEVREPVVAKSGLTDKTQRTLVALPRFLPGVHHDVARVGGGVREYATTNGANKPFDCHASLSCVF